MSNRNRIATLSTLGFILVLISLPVFSTQNPQPMPSNASTSNASKNNAPQNQKGPQPQDQKDQKDQILTPQAALKRLMDGNKRFMNDKTICPERTQERRLATVEKQKPFAIVVGCSDSRIPPEFAFDQGIGDVFVVRIAGNVVSKLEIESVEYSTLHNGSSIIVVLGHQNCGAVQAVMDNNTRDIESIAELIKPALHKADHSKLSLEEAIITNVKNSVARIKRSKDVATLIKAGKIDVVGGYYDLATGEVRIVTEETAKTGT